MTQTHFDHNYKKHLVLQLRSKLNINPCFRLSNEAHMLFVTYSTYETIQINCTLNPKQYGHWTFSWKHYWNGVFIRTLEYTITDNIAFWIYHSVTMQIMESTHELYMSTVEILPQPTLCTYKMLS
jgi:hypothetical protein